MRRGLAAALLLLATGLQAAPPPHRAVYDVRADGLKLGEARYLLREEAGGRLRYRNELVPTGLVGRLVGGHAVEESLLEVVDGALRPLRYRYRREGRKARTVVIDFDWGRMRAVHEIDARRWVLPLRVGVLDKLSVQLALMSALAEERGEYRYSVADGGRLKQYHFRRLGTETVETPAGRFEAVVVERRRDRRSTRYWAAPALDYLPVRAVRYKDGRERLRMVLVRYEPG